MSVSGQYVVFFDQLLFGRGARQGGDGWSLGENIQTFV